MYKAFSSQIFTDQDKNIAKNYGLALFDFDGTIIRGDVSYEFLYIVFKLFPIKSLIKILDPSFISLLFKYIFFKNKNTENKLFRLLLKNSITVLGHSIDNQILQEIDSIIESKLNIEIFNKVKKHQKQNHLVVIISASPDILIENFCQKQQIKLIGTKLQKRQSVFTGRISGKICNRINKVQRLQEKLGGLKQYKKIYAYGNSDADLEMLSLATKKEYQYLVLQNRFL